MKCMKVLVHQQPYKEILWNLGLKKTLLFEVVFFFMISPWLDFSLWLPLWKSSCLIILEIWSLVLNLVLLSSKSRLTKPWFHNLVDKTLEEEKLLKLRNQIPWFEQPNLGNSKFNSLFSPINKDDFFQGNGLIKQD